MPSLNSDINRRDAVRALATVVVAGPASLRAVKEPLRVVAGPDRITVLPGKTYLRGLAPAGLTAEWSKQSGAGQVVIANARALQTTATFSKPGVYVLKLTSDKGQTSARPLGAVYTRRFLVNSHFWNARVKALIVNWIPHCINFINRDDMTLGQGGIDNFVEAGKKLRGENAGLHKATCSRMRGSTRRWRP